MNPDILTAYREAEAADLAFEDALRVAGQTRWMRDFRPVPSVLQAYDAKVAADRRMHEAFAAAQGRAA